MTVYVHMTRNQLACFWPHAATRHAQRWGQIGRKACAHPSTLNMMRLQDVVTHTHGYGVIVGYRSKLKSMVLQGINMGRIGTSTVESSKLLPKLTGEDLLGLGPSALM